MIFFLKTVLLTTGMAIWWLVLIFLFGFIVFKIRTWPGWKGFEKWWEEAIK